MNPEFIEELKNTLDQFHELLTAEMAEAKGEPEDELLAPMERVRNKLKDVHTQEQFKALLGDFGWDFFNVYSAILSTNEYVEYDEEEFECEDDECEFEEESED